MSLAVFSVQPDYGPLGRATPSFVVLGLRASAFMSHSLRLPHQHWSLTLIIESRDIESRDIECHLEKTTALVLRYLYGPDANLVVVVTAKASGRNRGQVCHDFRVVGMPQGGCIHEERLLVLLLTSQQGQLARRSARNQTVMEFKLSYILSLNIIVAGAN